MPIRSSAALFYAPPGGTAALAQYGIAHASYGVCTDWRLAVTITQLSGLPFAESDPDYAGSTPTGVPVDIQGNQLGNTPPYSISFGAQYTTPVGGGYNLVSRFDYFWEAAMCGRIFNGPADRIDVVWRDNALFTLNAPDNQWYVSAYAKNLFGGNHVTGSYLTSSSSGLWTGVFYGEPRTSASRSAHASRRDRFKEKFGRRETGALFLWLGVSVPRRPRRTADEKAQARKIQS